MSEPVLNITKDTQPILPVMKVGIAIVVTCSVARILIFFLAFCKLRRHNADETLHTNTLSMHQDLQNSVPTIAVLESVNLKEPFGC